MSGAATTAGLLRCALRHKLSPSEWAVFALLATEPKFILYWQAFIRQLSGELGDYRREVGLGDAALRKGLRGLERRGWVFVARTETGIGYAQLLPIAVAQWPDKANRPEGGARD